MNSHTVQRMAVALATLAIVQCGRGDSPSYGTKEPTSSTTSSQTQTTTARDRADPCSLLERRDVETVVGPLAGPPYRTREDMDPIEPVIDGKACVYETPGFRAVLLSVEWHDGPLALKVLTLPGQLLAGPGAKGAETETKAAKTLLPGGVQVDGEWDEARSLGCCEIFALRGDQLVTLDYRASGFDTDKAVRILNQALLRLEHPLPLDGNAGNDAAARRAELRPKPRSACGLLSRGEVESVLGQLAVEPRPDAKDDTLGCTYRFTQEGSKEGPLAGAPKEFQSFVGALTGGKTGMVTGLVDTGIQIRWRGGFRRASDSMMIGGAVAENFGGTPGAPKRIVGRVEGGPWDEATQTGLTFTAVKKDVAITIDTPPMLTPEQVELRRRLVAKTIDALASPK
jgi:hypothetical protein